MSYKPRTLFRLIEEINKELFLPHIQRPFVWEEEQMYRLFDSLMRNYPIQTLLFWRTKDEIKARKFMGEVKWDSDLSDFYEPSVSKEGVQKVFVLDGQQRIQSLYSIFSGAIQLSDGQRAEAYFDATSGHEPDDHGNFYTIRFSSQHLELPWYRISDLIGRDSQKNSEDLSDTINDILDQRDHNSGIPPVLADLSNRQRRVRKNMSQLVSLLREEKHFWVQELDGVASQYPYKSILEIFIRVNSGGTKLDSSDLMFAAMKEGWDEIEEAIEETTELLNGTNLSFDKTFPLKCLLAVHGKGVETNPEKFDGTEGRKLLEQMGNGWDRAETAFLELRDFLKNDLKVYADKVVRSYNSFIPLFDYLYHNPKPNERSKALMRAYYYKAQMFGWYGSSTDAVVNALHSLVGKVCSGGFPLGDIKDHFRARGMQTELTAADLSDKRKRFILLNLVYVDQMGSSPFDVKFKGNEPHIDHIYPKHGLRTKLGLLTADIDTIGNFRFVGATDNIRKRAELPASYFSRLKGAGCPIDKHLLLTEYSDAPGKLAFDLDSYKAFRDARANRILEIAGAIINPELAAVAAGA